MDDLAGVWPPEEDSGGENSDGGLQIVIESPRPKRRGRVELDEADKQIIACVEKDLEDNLEEKATKANLTAHNVKNILKQVCTNEEVLALIRQAENPEENTEPITNYEPKFTRSKTKEYLSTNNQTTVIPWMSPPKTSEVQILFNEELQEDSSGDEYVPNRIKRKVQSNLNTLTVSSIQNKKAANIALRTRSKLSLSGTPLEEIEEAFIPPDITTDMYDMNCDDHDWEEFLQTFTKPLEEVTKANEDEEHDPEYNILADEEMDQVDREELRADRAVTVSRKELNTLMAELFEYADMYNDELREKTHANVNTTEDIQADNNVDDNLETDSDIVMERTQIPILAQQMRQHVQLATQNFLLTYEHPEFDHFASQFKEYLLSFQKALEDKTASMFYTINLFSAVKLIEDWEQLFATKSEQVLETKLYVDRVIVESINAKLAGIEYIVTFPPLVMETISKSTVFMYPDLLPRIPFKSTRTYSTSKNPYCFFTKSEEQLIAIFLEQCLPAIKQDPFHTKKGKVNMRHVSHYIHKYLFPLVPEHKVHRYITRKMNPDSADNPIQYYFRTKKAPPTVHYVFPMDPNNILPPCRVKPALLPHLWREYNYSNCQEEKVQETSVDPPTTIVVSPQPYPVIKISNPSGYDVTLSKKVVAQRKQATSATKRKKIEEDTQTIATMAENEVIGILRDMPSLGATPVKNPNGNSDATVSEEASQTGIAESQELSFQNILQQCTTPSISGEVKRNFQEVSEFSLSGQLEIISAEKDNPDDINELMKACTTVKNVTKKEPSGAEKKRAKLRREYLANLIMATPDDPETESQKQENFAIAFFDKIQDSLEESDYNKAVEILGCYEATNRKFRDFYKDLQAVLEPKYKELSDEFLLFLTTVQAKSVGKLLPHFLMKNMEGFIKKMLLYFKDQPTQLKKITKALTDLAETPDVRMEAIKSAILPLLKGNVALTELFLQNFSDETPPKLLTNGPYEVVDFVKELARQPGEEDFETIVVPDTDDPYGGPSCICICHKDDGQQFTQHCTRCGLKFIQGKVYVQTGKALRPAIVSFLTNPEKDHTKRLSATIRKRSDTSPNKQVTSPSKDFHPHDESRNSNESDDDCDGGKKKTKRKRKVNRRDKSILGKDRGKNKDFGKIGDKGKSKAKSRKPTKKRVNVKKVVEHKPGSTPGQLKRLAEEALEIEYNAPAEFVELKISSDHSGESESEFFESSQDITNTDSDESNEPTIPVRHVIGTDNEPWTREEDKIILQTFQQRSDCEETLHHISHVLQNRSVIEIKNRFKKLMSLLQQMAKEPTS